MYLRIRRSWSLIHRNLNWNCTSRDERGQLLSVLFCTAQIHNSGSGEQNGTRDESPKPLIQADHPPWYTSQLIVEALKLRCSLVAFANECDNLLVLSRYLLVLSR